jgi:hypothetical protein
MERKMNDNEKNDPIEKLKKAGFLLAQALYKSDNTDIRNIRDLIKKNTGRMFNYIHNNKPSEFLLYVQKICASIYCQPPKDAIELLRAQDARKFKKYALAFMMGFMSDKKEKKVEQGGNDEQ